MTVKRKKTSPLPLSPAEKRVLVAFRRAFKKAGTLPELREVAAELGTSRQNAEFFLKRLVEKGRMERIARYRGYREKKIA